MSGPVDRTNMESMVAGTDGSDDAVRVQTGTLDRLALDASVTMLHGVGPAAAERLAAAGIRTLGDLLLYFPRRHREIAEIAGPDDAHVGCYVRVRGRVERVTRAFLPGRKSLVTVTFASPDGERFAVPFFNQPWLRKSFQPGMERQLEGRLQATKKGFALTEPVIVNPRMDAQGACVVRYPSVDGISEPRLRTWIDKALARAAPSEEFWDEVPAALRAETVPLGQALRAMHQPRTVEEHERARRGFALREALRLFRRVEAARRRRMSVEGPRFPVGEDHDPRVRTVLPFPWTGDQERAVRSIRQRLAGPSPMGVLLQGDVGTGKTAVALDAILAASVAGWQTAFLAPTEVLAEQLLQVLSELLEPAGVRTAYLSGSLPAAERRAVDAALARGELDLVVGTHALFSEGTSFARLGLVIVDEQHRFGVEQRTRLVAKGRSPHVLVMTATPIPRTQALARFGDLDLEILRDRPSGRLPAPAIHVDREAWPRVLRAIARHARRGGRVYVVCPKIGEDGEKGGAVRLAQDLGGRFRCGLVHGRLPVAERRARTAAFRDGAFDVLVGTTVLEVGVDVPTATLMVVVGADRFGLAQLHQLRGRVGRGRKRGACVLIGERSDRVVALCRTRDGFDLAEEDLRLRGAGELLGAQQTGAIDFRALDPLDDYEILRAARDAVRAEEVLPCGP
ncbi:MAG: helicase-related protein [Planctomycetota bacterium]|nr:helicase-related protein [Planctomycetota bacterium]MDA0933033.1 helicase-related protein [Planctomycetota bacterium]